MQSLDAFYKARRLFSRLAHEEDEGLQITHQLESGDMIIFDNTRVLHSRSSIAPTDAPRQLEGCYLNRDGLEFNSERLRRQVMTSRLGADDDADHVSFRSLAEGTKEDYDLMTAKYVEACSAQHLAERALAGGVCCQMMTTTTGAFYMSSNAIHIV